MKQLSLFLIRELALKSNRAVFSVQQLANLIGKPKKIAKVYSWRLVKKGLAKPLLRGKISFSDDDFVVSSQLIEPSYVSMRSALLFHGIATQVPVAVECVSTKNTFSYPNLGIYCHKIPKSLFYGFEKQQKAGSYFFVADAEKALVDGVYLNAFSKTEAEEYSALVNKQKLSQYVKRFKANGRKKLEKWLLA